MKTFEYRVYPHRKQRALLMQCLIDSRHLYNEMLATLKQRYEQQSTFPTQYDLTATFKDFAGE
jgi:transposase